MREIRAQFFPADNSPRLISVFPVSIENAHRAMFTRDSDWASYGQIIQVRRKLSRTETDFLSPGSLFGLAALSDARGYSSFELVRARAKLGQIIYRRHFRSYRRYELSIAV